MTVMKSAMFFKSILSSFSPV